MTRLTGLQWICRAYGGMVIDGEKWIWDYKQEKAVLESELKAMSKEEQKKCKAESERAKWERIAMDLGGGK